MDERLITFHRTVTIERADGELTEDGLERYTVVFTTPAATWARARPVPVPHVSAADREAARAVGAALERERAAPEPPEPDPTPRDIVPYLTGRIVRSR